jgi:hypothetical protein
MDVNDNAFCLNKRVALEFIASKLAPTGDRHQGPIIAARRPPETGLFQLPYTLAAGTA